MTENELIMTITKWHLESAVLISIICMVIALLGLVWLPAVFVGLFCTTITWLNFLDYLRYSKYLGNKK